MTAAGDACSIAHRISSPLPPGARSVRGVDGGLGVGKRWIGAGTSHRSPDAPCAPRCRTATPLASGNPAAACAGEARSWPGVAFVRIGAEADPGFQPGERRHVRVAQLKIEQRDVLPDPRRSGRLRDHHVAQLQMPAEHDLGGGPVVQACQLRDDWTVQRVPLPEGAPRLGGDAVRGVEVPQCLLLELGGARSAVLGTCWPTVCTCWSRRGS